MTVSLQIRNVPHEVRDRIAERARKEGKSLQAYLLELVEREARFSTNAEMFTRTAPLRKPLPRGAVEEIVREARDQGAEIDRRELP